MATELLLDLLHRVVTICDGDVLRAICGCSRDLVAAAHAQRIRRALQAFMVAPYPPTEAEKKLATLSLARALGAAVGAGIDIAPKDLAETHSRLGGTAAVAAAFAGPLLAECSRRRPCTSRVRAWLHAGASPDALDGTVWDDSADSAMVESPVRRHAQILLRRSAAGTEFPTGPPLLALAQLPSSNSAVREAAAALLASGAKLVDRYSSLPLIRRRPRNPLGCMRWASLWKDALGRRLDEALSRRDEWCVERLIAPAAAAGVMPTQIAAAHRLLGLRKAGSTLSLAVAFECEEAWHEGRSPEVEWLRAWVSLGADLGIDPWPHAPPLESLASIAASFVTGARGTGSSHPSLDTGESPAVETLRAGVREAAALLLTHGAPANRGLIELLAWPPLLPSQCEVGDYDALDRAAWVELCLQRAHAFYEGVCSAPIATGIGVVDEKGTEYQEVDRRGYTRPRDSNGWLVCPSVACVVAESS